MERSFTLLDLYKYQIEVEAARSRQADPDIAPGKQAVKNIVNYAKALKVITTRSAGNAYFLMN